MPVGWQAQLLGISRGSVYYKARCVSAADLALMWRLDALHPDHPFAGSRMRRDLLTAEGVVGRQHVETLMKRMGSRRSIAGRTRRVRRRTTRASCIFCAAW